MNTPTDDEREALASLIQSFRYAGRLFAASAKTDYRDADRILAAGFRRAVVPEPSAEPPLRSAWHATPAVTSRGAEPQGEPSSIPFYDEKMRELAEVREQGEPSDSEIDAALFAYWGENAKVYGSRNGMRAALRAAAEAR